MFRESYLEGSSVTAREGALGHPDGSINFDAYRERAQHERAATMIASLSGAWWLISGVFAGKPIPAARHHAT